MSEDNSNLNKFLSQFQSTTLNRPLTEAIIATMGGEHAIECLHTSISKNGVNEHQINFEYGDLHNTWSESCLMIFNNHQESCLAVAKNWYLEWANGQDSINVITSLINADIRREISFEASLSSEYIDVDAAVFLAQYESIEILAIINRGTKNKDTELKQRLAEKLVNCACVAVCSYYAGFKEMQRVEKQNAKESK